MSRYVIAADIAGRPTLSTAGSNRMTAAAVTVRASLADEARVMARSLPKWRDADEAIATQAIEQIERNVLGVGIASMTKPPGAWEDFFAAAKPLQDQIVAEDRSPAGFVKPANVGKLVLLVHAYTLAGTQAVKVDRDPHIKDLTGLDLIECTIVCDTEIEGEENLAAFREMWAQSDRHQPKLNSLGLRTVTRNVVVTTDEEDPLLRLADFAAGIAHSALIPQPGRIRMPVEHEAAKRLLGRLNATSKLTLVNQAFDARYEEIFGEALEAAREQ
jgi:hypothetical protein